MEQYDFGIIGLGVMGRNLLLNVADHGFAAAGLDLDGEKVTALKNEAAEGHKINGYTAVEEFAASLRHPRAVMLLVPAGKAVDAAISSLLPHLDEGDIVVDGGNTFFEDTDRRVEELAQKGIHFFGMGVSGGEKGARFGPSMMPGGDQQAYERLKPIFESIAAKVDGQPCVTYLGKGSAGHYVKMVHNGIEYGIMQLISEVYDILRRGCSIDNNQLQQVFADWSESELKSFLIEITAEVLSRKDDMGGKLLVDVISDVARAKGTGKWTSQNAMNLQAPVPVIDSAVMMRDLSKYKEERLAASSLYPRQATGASSETHDVIALAKDALYFAMITAYAQGLAQLALASKEYAYGLKLEEVVTIWRGGCIIRAVCLEDFRQAYVRRPDLPNLLLDKEIAGRLGALHNRLREFVKLAIDLGIPASALSASLAYFDAYRSEVLPTYLIQAQRDYFGAHRYERTDREGSFHTEWD
ncbi:NADP-dependent phosphogluconate dehydrogenase [Arcticibacter sp. MXS-1]|uniref:NADP-dependent phosphogluconate dehydrogenase n=1 Tax=Arcticibacter sp. MXS-1 TaxID=3341726 RepID=UPI0035A8240A